MCAVALTRPLEEAAESEVSPKSKIGERDQEKISRHVQPIN